MPLTPSQRIRLRKEISRRLGGEDWYLIDATLHEFGMSTSESWSGAPGDYLLAMTKDGHDKELVELARHLDYELDDLASLQLELDSWPTDSLRMFVSHISRERTVASQLRDTMRDYGISCFVAHEDIQPNQEWQKRIVAALGSCDVLVALLHDGFHESDWTDQEIGFAMGRGIPVYAICYGAAPYGFIGRFQAFDAAGKPTAKIARELFEVCRSEKQLRQRLASSLLASFEQSPSFADAKERIGFLEELETWDQAFPKRLLMADINNSQISGSFGVPTRVKALAKKWRTGGA